jgi:hypothetical protein
VRLGEELRDAQLVCGVAIVALVKHQFSNYTLYSEMPLVTNAQATHQEITHADLGMVREIEIEE